MTSPPPAPPKPTAPPADVSSKEVDDAFYASYGEGTLKGLPPELQGPGGVGRRKLTLDAKDATELREIVRLLLATVGYWFDDTVARWSGRDRWQRQRKRRGGQQSGEKRREEALAILQAIQKIKAGNLALTDHAAARVYLRTHDPAWEAGTEEERFQKLSTLLRSLSRARKKN